MKPIEIKPGVMFHPDTTDRSEFRLMEKVAALQAPADYSITITSAYDGNHAEVSKHYTGWAIDIRTRDFPNDVWVWARRIQNSLGDRYFVLVEATHIHIQFNG